MPIRRFIIVLVVWLLAAIPAVAAAEGHDHLPNYAETIFEIPIPGIGPFIVTNSMLMVWIVAVALIVIAQLATRDLKLIPRGLQNFVEWLVENLYGFLEGILGKHLVKRTFWFFATIFILILATNWAGLIPGVGTMGWFKPGGFDGNPHDTFRPLLRGGNADLNMTAAMACIFAVLWFYWAITENGLKGFMAHIFAPKGSFRGIMLAMMVPVFL